MNSEQYIEQKFSETNFGDAKVYTIDELRDKKKNQLKNAAKTIGNGVNQNLIVGVVDDSLLGSGKDGVVFTGKTVFIRLDTGFLSGQIDLSRLNSITYTADSHLNKLDKMVFDYTLSWDDGSQQSLTTNSLETGNVLSGISELLADFKAETNEIQESNHNLDFSDLDEKSQIQYLKVIYLYLNADSDFSEKDQRNYAEIETKLEVSEKVDTEMRKYRFSKPHDDIFEQLDELKNSIPEGSRKLILQLLISDILTTFDEEKLDSWKDDVVLLKLAEKAEVSETDISTFANSQKLNRDLMDNKLSTREYEDQLKKLTVGASSLTSGAASALTGATVSFAQFGVFDVGLGLLTLSTGGVGLAAVGIGAASVAAYKGVEHLIKGNDTREAMRSEMLQNKIKKLMGSQSLIIKDINYLSDELVNMWDRMDKVTADSLKQSQQLKQLLLYIKKLSSAGAKADAERRERERQLIIAKLPAQIDFEKLHDLVESHTLGDIEPQILKSYDEEGNLLPNLTLDELQSLSHLLDGLEYNKKATVANAKSVAKNTKEKTQSAVEEFKKDENVQKVVGKAKNSLNSLFKGI